MEKKIFMFDLNIFSPNPSAIGRMQHKTPFYVELHMLWIQKFLLLNWLPVVVYRALQEKQGRTHKQCSLMDSYICMRYYWSTKKD